MKARGNGEVHKVLVLVLLPATTSLLTPPVSFPSRPWPPRWPQSTCDVRCIEDPSPSGGRDTTYATATSSNHGSWRADVSSWVAGATSVSRSVLYASTPARIGAWVNGSILGGGGGGGGGNNGTDRGVPTGGAMDGGDDGDEASDVNVCSSSSGSRGDCSSTAAELDDGTSKTSVQAAPWVWLSAMWGLYAALLRRSPLVTKAVTSGVLALGGDLAAQFFEFQQQASSGGRGPFFKDTRRLLAVAIDSTLITGPSLHALYELLERYLPTATGGFVPAALHVLIDTFIFDPVFVISFFCVTGVLESRSLKQDVLPALRREFWPAVHGSWVVSLLFCPLQFVTFRYLPVEFRVLSVNVCDIAWTSVLSYFSHKTPPEGEPVLADDGGGTPVFERWIVAAKDGTSASANAIGRSASLNQRRSVLGGGGGKGSGRVVVKGFVAARA